MHLKVSYHRVELQCSKCNRYMESSGESFNTTPRVYIYMCFYCGIARRHEQEYPLGKYSRQVSHLR